MANIRIAQQLSTGYNPDGTPGTVTTGVPGPGPTDAQVLAAVSAYLETNPVGTKAADGTKRLASGYWTNDADTSAFGVGVDGSGSYVYIGTYGSTVDGYVGVEGSTVDADLHLKAKGNGRIWVSHPITSNSPITISDQDLLLDGGSLQFGDTGRDGSIAVGQVICQNPMAENIADSYFQNLRAGASYFSSSTFSLSSGFTSVTDLANQDNWNTAPGIAVMVPPTGAYAAVHASAFTVSSDRRLKTDIVELTGALEEVRTTPAYSYRMNDERRRGLIADEAPTDVVRTDDRGFQLIESYDLIGTLWAAVRELADKLEGMDSTCRCQPTR